MHTQAHFGSSVYHWTFFGWDFKAYAALIAFVANLVVCIVGTAVLTQPDGMVSTVGYELLPSTTK